MDVALILSVDNWPVDSWPFGGKCKFRECLERVVLPRTCGHKGDHRGFTYNAKTGKATLT